MEVAGNKRSCSISPAEDAENYESIEDKRPRRAGERIPLSDQVNYMTVSVPDNGRRTRVAVRSADNFFKFLSNRIPDENFLVWSCSKSWRDLKEVADVLVTRAEQARRNASDKQPSKLSSVSPELWLRKYAPYSYMDLVSDEATNRAVLQWCRLWDKGVFKKERKSYSHLHNQPSNQQKQWPNQKGPGNKGGGGAANHLAMRGPEMDVTDNWPAQRICLLTGPPGLGKTTLAHIAARHCGYEIVEVNASDDRSANVFRDYLESVVETRGMLNVVNKDSDQKPTTKPKPACLILDEIDGAPQAAIDVLIGYVTAAVDAEGKAKAKRRGKDKRDHELRRPVICICNDQYATSLRNLRRHCFVVVCSPPPPERLVFRVGEIAKRERIDIESNAISNIVEKSRGDIRVCVNILQTLKAAASAALVDNHVTATQNRRGRVRVTNEQILRLPRMGFTKDVEQSMFDCLSTILRQPPVTSHVSRYETVQASVQMNTDHDLLINGIFENYPNARIRDDFLIAASQMADWLATADTLQQYAMSIPGAEIGFAMTYTTTPLVSTACSLMFATPAPGRLTFPKLSMERRQLILQRNNQLSSFIAGMTPAQRIYFSSPVSVIFDLLPNLVEIIQPSLRPVSAQLFSASEKAEVARVVQVLASFGLTFVQRLTQSNDQNQWQSRNTQFGYYLEPPVDTFNIYQNKPIDNTGFGKTNNTSNDGEHAKAPIWRLSQTVRQLLSSEVQLYLSKRASVRCGPLLQVPGQNDVAIAENDKTATKPALAPVVGPQSNLSTMVAGNEAGQMQSAIDSFFTRSATSKKNATTSFNDLIRSPPNSRSRDKVWFNFNEGYSNAVRRPARVKQFF